MLGKLMNDDKALVASMREAHEIADGHDDKRLDCSSVRITAIRKNECARVPR